MTDREPTHLLLVLVDEGGPMYRDPETPGRWWHVGNVHPDDLLRLPNDSDARLGYPADRASAASASGQPCELGCTVKCWSCGGSGKGGCPVNCTDGYVPAVHTSVDECRPPLPENIEVVASDWAGRAFIWQVVMDGMPIRLGYEPSEAERDRALWAAVRDIVRQHNNTKENDWYDHTPGATPHTPPADVCPDCNGWPNSFIQVDADGNAKNVSCPSCGTGDRPAVTDADIIGVVYDFTGVALSPEQARKMRAALEAAAKARQEQP